MRGHFLKPRFVFDLLSVFDNLDDAAAAIDGGLHVIGNRPVVFNPPTRILRPYLWWDKVEPRIDYG